MHELAHVFASVSEAIQLGAAQEAGWLRRERLLARERRSSLVREASLVVNERCPGRHANRPRYFQCTAIFSTPTPRFSATAAA
jgi:hypothetical protein